mmetsp:Transcript_44895/g.71326  ORF Transcript_44895/g.71326 Transcript_44895/m.71326 type:complete len:303 (-) Transcript_44895:104-1012(-)
MEKPSTAPANLQQLSLQGLQDPEWIGAKSAMHSDRLTGLPLRRRIVDVVDAPFKHGAATGLALNGFGRYFTDSEGLAAQQGRRHVRPPDCKTLAWRPGKRPLLEPGLLLIEKPEGLGKVEQPLPKVYAMTEKRHVRQVESKLEHQDRPQAKRTVYRENRIRAADQPAKEVDITTEMTRKARVEDMMTRRNLIDCSCLGDKYYRHPEYAPGFYKAGGLITGSSFHRGMYKKTVPRNSMSMLLLSEGGRRVSKSYQEKQAEREVLEAQCEVKALTKSWEHQTLKECDKTYEPVDSEDDAPEAGA